MSEASPASGVAESASQGTESGTQNRDLDVTSVSSTDKTDAQAGSSSAQAEKAPTMLDAVEAVLNKKGSEASPAEEGSSSDKPEKAQDGKAEDGEDDLSDDPTDEELEKYHSRTRQRIKKLVNQRNEFKAEVDELRGPAEGFERLNKFVAEQNLSVDEVNIGLDIMALMRNDPHRAHEKLRPYWTALQEIVGNILPTDLQQAVDGGEISEKFARETAASRSKAAVADDQRKRVETRVTQTEQYRQHTDATNAMVTAVSEWETKTWAPSDPNYNVLKARVAKEIKLDLFERQASGQPLPRTAAQAVEHARSIKDRVVQEMGQFMPRRQESKPPPGSGSSAPGAQPQAKTFMDVINRVAAG